MRSFRENAEAARAETDHNFERRNDHGRENGTAGSGALLSAH